MKQFIQDIKCLFGFHLMGIRLKRKTNGQTDPELACPNCGVKL